MLCGDCRESQDKVDKEVVASKFDSALQKLKSDLSFLDKDLSRLCLRLEPLLEPEKPMCTSEDTKCPEEAQLLALIKGFSMQVQNLNNRVGSVLERLVL